MTQAMGARPDLPDQPLDKSATVPRLCVNWGRVNWGRVGWVHAAALLAYVLLTVVMTWPLATALTQAIPGDGFDGWQNYWNLWWVKVALVERVQSPYFTDLLYYPTGVALYFHTLNPFNGLASLPVQLSAGLIPAYNFVVFLSWALAGYGAFLLTLWLLAPGGSAAQPSIEARLRTAYFPAFLAGVIYTFAPFHMAHLLGHMQVMSLEWAPFYILYLLRGTQRSRLGQSWRHDGLLAGLFLILAGLCDWYFVMYLFLFSALYLLWACLALLITRRAHPTANTPGIGRGLVATLRPALTAGLVFLVVLSPVLFPMMRDALQSTYMVRPSLDLYAFSASVADFLVPNRLHPLWQPAALTWIGNQVAPISEHTIAIGYLALALAILALAFDRKVARFWGVAALFFALLALGPRLHLGNITWDDIPADAATRFDVEGWSPYTLLNEIIPFMRISRSVSRFSLMVQLCVAVLAGLGLAAWLRRLRPGTGRLIGGLALALILFEYWVAPYPLSPPDTPPVYAELANTDGAILNLPMNYDRPGYLLYQTVHTRPLTVAYVSREDPRTLTERIPVLQNFRHLGPDIVESNPAQVGRTVLQDLGVGAVVLDRYKMPGGPEREYTEALATAIFAGAPPDYQDDRVTVYRTAVVDAPEPYVVLGPEGWGPLTTAEGAPPGRAIGPQPAVIEVRHAAPATQLRLRYRTPAGTGITLTGAGDGSPVQLAPAPAGAEIVIPLAPYALTGGDPLTTHRLNLVAGAADGVWVEGIGLETP